MSTIGTSPIALLVIATLAGLVFLLALRALSGKELKVNRRSLLLSPLVPLLVGTAMFGEEMEPTKAGADGQTEKLGPTG